jgi:predicted metal-dependent HD superfamily phosphohydrolase
MSATLFHRLESRWSRLLAALGLREPEHADIFEALVKAYEGPGRYYHTLTHLEAVLATIELLEGEARRPDLVQIAAWFHDMVYDTHATDNEERSARLAEAACVLWGLPAEDVAAVGRLIRATRTHEAAGDDRDAHVLLDADLAILGSDEAVYDAYAAAIRREYAWVPEAEYRQGRARVLEGFLRREHLFRLGEMRNRHETQARRNLAREIAALNSSDGTS